MSAARRWLVHWRTRRAPAPFFLYVDFRAEGPAPPSGAGDAALAGLLDQLHQLEIADETLVVVALTDPDAAPALGDDVRAIVQPPAAWRWGDDGIRSIPLVRASELGTALYRSRLTERDGFLWLPGLPGRPLGERYVVPSAGGSGRGGTSDS